MKMLFKKIILIILLTMVISPYSFADEDEDNDEGHRERGRERGHSTEMVEPVKNATYLKECGACHFAYQPQLLPQKSWEKIMKTLDNHFKDNALLDDTTALELSEFLVKNCAEKSSSELSRKILSSIGKNETILRISETPYFKHEHRKIDDEVFKRKSIGSRSNCIACHPTADKGDYEEDNIIIPKN